VIVSRSMRVIWAFVVAGVAVALLAGVVLAQALFVGTVTRDANLRAGPGTTFAVVGSARAGSSVVVSGTNPAGDWYQLDDGKWIAAFLVRSGDAAPPVATARPTARPTVRPTLAVTPQEWLRYSMQTIGAIDALSQALDQAGALMSNPRITSSTWVRQVAVQFAIIRQSHETLAALEPPSSLVWLHTRVVAATGDCDEATYAIANGFDNLDVAEMERGAALISSCASQLGDLADTLTEIQASMTPTPTPRATPTRRP
jgi:hypothetical protein